jgi:oligopeptidase B
MGAVANQAPELYGAIVAHVPFVDVLNTMLDGTLPLTPGEWSE